MHASHFGLAARPRHADLFQRSIQPFEMRLIVDELAMDNRRHFIDAIGKQKAAIEDRHLSLILGNIVSIHIDDPAHDLSFGFGACPNQIRAPESMVMVSPPFSRARESYRRSPGRSITGPFRPGD